MKEKILSEIVNNSKKLINFKTIKENYKEFEKAFEFIKNELKDYIIIEKTIDNYKNLIITIMASEKEMKNVTEILRDLI